MFILSCKIFIVINQIIIILFLLQYRRIYMFHLFTLQGTRIDTTLERLPRTTRVHHTKSNNPVRKFNEKGNSPVMTVHPGGKKNSQLRHTWKPHGTIMKAHLFTMRLKS